MWTKTNGATAVPSVADFRSMDSLAAQRYLDSISDPATRDRAYANFAAASADNTRDFLSASRPRLYPLVAPGGTAQTQLAYAQNATLIMDVPPVANAVGEALLVCIDLQFTYTANGTGPFINLTAAGWDAIVNEITLTYGAGGIQHRAHPFFYRAIDEWARGYQKSSGFRLLNPASGPIFSDSWLDGRLYSSPSFAAGVNTIRVWYRLDFNPMHDLAPEGLLSFSGGNGAQLMLRTGNIAGVDPLNNAVYTNGTITNVTGTIQAFLEYRDGTTLTTPGYLNGPNLGGIDTFQTQQQAARNITNADVYTSDRLTAVGRHYYMFTVVVDGVTPTAFSSFQNILGIALTEDEVGNRAIEQFGLNTRIPIELYWERIRRTFGRNFPAGFVPHVIAPSMLEVDPDARLGVDVLNMSDRPEDRGYSNVYQQIALDTISTALGIQPRLVTFFGSVTRPLQIIG